MKKKWKRKDYSFARFFKGARIPFFGREKPANKTRQLIVWPRKQGTYVRKIHGVLPHSKHK